MCQDSFAELYSKLLVQLERARTLDAQRLREWDSEFQQLEKSSDAQRIYTLEERAEALQKLAEVLYGAVLALVRGSVSTSTIREVRKTLPDRLFPNGG